MDRRGFLRAFGIGGAGVAAGGAIIHKVAEATANDVAVTRTIQPSTPKPTDAVAPFEEGMRLIAAQAALRIDQMLRLDSRKIAVHKVDHIAISGDIMRLPDGTQVKLARHMESTFPVGDDLAEVLEGSRWACMTAASIALAEAISRDCDGQNLLCYARHPLPLRGLGAIAERGDSERVRLRAILYYTPAFLNHHITIDTLYGVA